MLSIFSFLLLVCVVKVSSENCTDKHYLCANGKCIDENLTCDNFDHCGDNSDERTICPSGCETNDTFSPPGTIVEDHNWWYVCNRSRWRIAGCIINGKRFSVGDTFFEHMGEFWGRCDLLGSSYIRRHLQGCVDYNGNPVKPGTAYLSDPQFWSMCTGARQLFHVPGEGTIAINTVRRQVIGCFDGSSIPVPDDEQFIQINDIEHGMGVAYHCRIGNHIDWPEMVPVACVFKNNTMSSKSQEYVGLGDRCYLENDTAVYFCTIWGENSNNLTNIGINNQNNTPSWTYNWELSWNTSVPEVLENLKQMGYQRCTFGEEEKVQTGEERPVFRMAFSDSFQRRFKRRKRDLRVPVKMQANYFDLNS